jgi:hypothetical protein
MAGRTSTEEVPAMAEPRGSVKTLAIQLTDDQHAQLVLISQVEGLSLKDVLKQAVDALITAKRTQPDFAARAQAVLEEIDREAASRRQAIQTLFAAGDSAHAEPEAPTGRRGRRGGEQAEA